MLPGATSQMLNGGTPITPEEYKEFLEFKKQKEQRQFLNVPRVSTVWPAAAGSSSVFGSSIGSMNALSNMVMPKIMPGGVQLPVDRSNEVNSILFAHGSNPLLQPQKNYWLNYGPGIVSGLNTQSVPQSIPSLVSYMSPSPLNSIQSPISSLASFMSPITPMPLQGSVNSPVVSLNNQIQETISLPTSVSTPKAPTPKRSSSPIDVETVEPETKKHKSESEENQAKSHDFVARTTNMLPSLNNDLPPEVHHSCNQVCQHQDDGEAVETHIIITARPPAPPVDQDEKMSTDSESDYDSNIRPQETALQYKDRMVERAMKKNLASKRSREKRKREHERRQLERQKLEQRNIELASKLMELKETLNRLKPQICNSCNEQVQTFLDQHQKNDGMNIFVLRPCFKPDCRGNKNYNAGVKKTEAES